MVNRRDVLLGIGATFSLSGCAGDRENGSRSTQQPTTIATPTATATATATRRDTPTATNTETKTPTETQTATPDPYTRELNRIEQRLLSVYSDFKLGWKMATRPLDNPSTNPGNSSRLYEIRTALNDLDSSLLSDEQRSRKSRLRSAFWFIWWTKSIHKDVAKVTTGTRDIWKNQRGKTEWKQTIDPFSEVRRLEEAQKTASDNLEQLKEDSSKSGVAELNGYTEKDYNSVVSRYNTILPQEESLLEMLRSIRKGDVNWGQKDYSQASKAYENAIGFDSEPDWREAYQPLIDEMKCYASTMVERSEDFELAASLEAEGEKESAKVTRSNAPKPTEECDFETESQTATPQSVLKPTLYTV